LYHFFQGSRLFALTKCLYLSPKLVKSAIFELSPFNYLKIYRFIDILFRRYLFLSRLSLLADCSC
jgi:hypothetical protein